MGILKQYRNRCDNCKRTIRGEPVFVHLIGAGVSMILCPKCAKVEGDRELLWEKAQKHYASTSGRSAKSHLRKTSTLIPLLSRKTKKTLEG